jgi:hypothetical protein
LDTVTRSHAERVDLDQAAHRCRLPTRTASCVPIPSTIDGHERALLEGQLRLIVQEPKGTSLLLPGCFRGVGSLPHAGDIIDFNVSQMITMPRLHTISWGRRMNATSCGYVVASSEGPVWEMVPGRPVAFRLLCGTDRRWRPPAIAACRSGPPAIGRAYPAPTLTPADHDERSPRPDVDGRKRFRHAEELTARIPAEHLARIWRGRGSW